MKSTQKIFLLTILVFIPFLCFSQSDNLEVEISEINQLLLQSAYKSGSFNTETTVTYSFVLNSKEVIVQEVTNSSYNNQNKTYILPKYDIKLYGILINYDDGIINIMYGNNNNYSSKYIKYHSGNSDGDSEGFELGINIYIDNISDKDLGNITNLLGTLFNSIQEHSQSYFISQSEGVGENYTHNTKTKNVGYDYYSSEPSKNINTPNYNSKCEYIEYDESGIKTIVFNEEFENNRNNWELTNETNSSSKMESGYYIIESKNEYEINRLLKYEIDPKGNFTIESRFKLVKGDDGSGQGIIWGYKNNLNYFAFVISSDGQYEITVYDNGLRFNLTDNWENSDYIIKHNRWNKLKISKIGKAIVFSINNHFVEKRDFYSLGGNYIGFTLGQKRIISIDYIRVKQQQQDKE